MLPNMSTIIGKGGFARELYNYIGVLKSKMVLSDEYKLLPPWEKLNGLIAIGDGKVRERIVNENPDVLHWGIADFGKHYMNCTFKEGVIICPGTIITTNVHIGKHVIINLNCTVGHDVVIKEYTTLSPGANISGNVTIGKRCYIGTNAVIREKITICDDVIIGAGGVVVKDITEPGTYVGNPVKKIK